MQPQQAQISVWVCREEKLVLGLSRRTSCADVVRALVEERRGAAQAYCIVEKWRGFERILPSKTRIWRLWLAWGDEQSHVRFVLVKKEASLQSRAARSAEARVVLSRQSPGASGGPATALGGAISPEKQRRVVRKAFRKLEKMNRRKAQAAHRDAERMETLAHLVISQDHTIRQQIHRISQLDAEIDRCEAEVHFERVQRLGVNYVQDTYLVDGASAEQEEQEEQEELQELVRRSEQVCALQEELRQQEALRDSLAAQVQDELNRRWMQRRSREEAAAPPCSGPEQELLQEAERVRTQLDASLYIGLRLNTDLEAIRSDLELTQEIYRAREEEMRDLLEKVNILELEEESCSRGTDDERRMESNLERKSEWVEQARGLSKAHSGNDDDSDTGLSSLHSQDSDSQPVWESLV